MTSTVQAVVLFLAVKVLAGVHASALPGWPLKDESLSDSERRSPALDPTVKEVLKISIPVIAKMPNLDPTVKTILDMAKPMIDNLRSPSPEELSERSPEMNPAVKGIIDTAVALLPLDPITKGLISGATSWFDNNGRSPADVHPYPGQTREDESLEGFERRSPALDPTVKEVIKVAIPVIAKMPNLDPTVKTILDMAKPMIDNLRSPSPEELSERSPEMNPAVKGIIDTVVSLLPLDPIAKGLVSGVTSSLDRGNHRSPRPFRHGRPNFYERKPKHAKPPKQNNKSKPRTRHSPFSVPELSKSFMPFSGEYPHSRRFSNRRVYPGPIPFSSTRSAAKKSPSSKILPDYPDLQDPYRPYPRTLPFKRRSRRGLLEWVGRINQKFCCKIHATCPRGRANHLRSPAFEHDIKGLLEHGDTVKQRLKLVRNRLGQTLCCYFNRACPTGELPKSSPAP